ncbi:MarR family winged helix-turn-helix transcriptional regulator [Tepidamorphus sp. 3E244]|uniref:MarR family winged helix-turn-helix transcriptional regulator n=1 Tax=Tepidamorphus sp. 3E244 TaxID=3385498 RepID=UPI0038FCB79E
MSYQLLRAARLHRTRAASYLAEIGIHPGQETVLLSLADNDGQSMTALSVALGVKPPTITKMIARMGTQGLLTRSTAEQDKRSFTVTLTDLGREKATSLKKLWKRLEKEAMSGLEERDRKRFSKLLGQVSTNLAAPEA